MIAIVGAGISGLSLAYFLQKQNVPYLLLEKKENEHSPGGFIQSIREKEYLYELGPNSLLCDDFLLQWLNELELQTEIIEANPVSKSRFVFKNGRYQKLPQSPFSLFWSVFFSWEAKKQIFREPKIKSKTHPNETLTEFFERRFGREVVDYALEPFVSGIYAGNPDELLLKYTFPFLAELEQKFGSVIKGLKKTKSLGRKKSISFKNGMQTLPKKLAEKVKITYCQDGVQSIFRKSQSWEIITAEKNFQAEKVVITTPAYIAGDILQKIDFSLSETLQKIGYAPMVVVHTIYYKNLFRKPLNGFGALHPHKEKLFTLGHIWSSSVFEGRCKDNEVLFTSFVGGLKGIEKTFLDDNTLMSKVQKEIREIYKIDSLPVLQRVTRWQKAIPQYDKFILPAYERLQSLEQEGLYVCANWKDGVSVADCIKKAYNLAQKFK
ncbi:MAG: protoporphyrinogen oxidase [Raineya sp.]|nr:protoporphyrinogen oxidase [Raineya sp.]